MKLGIVSIVLVFSTSLTATEPIILETFYPDSIYAFAEPYCDLACSIAPSGDFIALYAVTTEGWYPSYYLKQYPLSGEATQYRIGAFWGPTGGGWFSPKICGYEDDKILIQETLVSDVQPYSSYKLRMLDLSPTHEHSTLYHGLVYDTNIFRTWKTDSIHASSFTVDWSNWESPMLRFLSNYTLYPAMWWEDSTYVMDGDTVFEIEDVELVIPAMLKNDSFYCALYTLSGIEGRHFVCLDDQSLLAQMDDIFPASSGRYIIQSHNRSFWIFQKEPDAPRIIRWTYDIETGDTSYAAIYTSTTDSNEYLGQFLVTLVEDAIILQFPVVSNTSSYEVSNWQSVVQKRLDMNTFSVQTTDTVFVFEPGTNHVGISITTDGISPQTLIATRTPEYSRLYYCGPLDLVGIEENEPGLPQATTIVSIYPNPSNGQIAIECLLPSNSWGADLDLFNMQGRLVWSHRINTSGTVFLMGSTLGVNNLASGVYLVHLSNGIYTDTRKVLLLK